MVSSGSSLTMSGHDSCKVSNNYVTSLKQLKSGNMISPFPPYNRQADRFIKQAPIGNKVTEYIETNRVSWKPFVVKLVSLFCLISVICLSVYLQARANGRNIELTRYYSQLNDTIDVLCDEGKLAMLVLERSNAN